MAKKSQPLSESQISKISLLKETGDAMNDDGEFALAILSYDEALAIDPNNENILYNKGMCQYDLEDTNGATITFEKIVDLNPKDDGALRWLAKCHHDNGIYEWAIDNYLKATQINDSVYYYWTELAQVYIKMGKDLDAIKAYEKATELECNAENLFNLGKLYYENRFNEWTYLDLSLKTLKEAVDLDKNDPDGPTVPAAKSLFKIVQKKHDEINKDNS